MIRLLSAQLGFCLLALAVSTPARADEKIYDQVVPSTVWVRTQLDPLRQTAGSGVLVDTRRGLIVTNYHLVQESPLVLVYFPTFDNGRVIAERVHYLRNERVLATVGRVLLRDARRDLAVIEVDRLPPQARAIKLAAASARQGQQLHLVGNPGNEGALWVYTSGTVRSAYLKQWQAFSDNLQLTLQGRVVEAQLPINPGDSGGPVVNSQAELVAVVSSADRTQQLVATCIDIAEISTLLALAEKAPRPGLAALPPVGLLGPALPPAKQQAEQPPKGVDPRVGQQLQAAKLKYAIDPDGVYRLLFTMQDGQPSQNVYIDSQTEQFQQLDMRRVWSIARVLDQPPTTELALKLLTASNTRKLGAWELQPLGSKYCIIFCARVNATLDGAALQSAVEFVHAEAADLAASRGMWAAPLSVSPKALFGDWQATSDKNGTQLTWTLTVLDSTRLTLAADIGVGAPTTVTGTYTLNNNELSISAYGRTERLGRIAQPSGNELTLEDGMLTIRFKRLAK